MRVFVGVLLVLIPVRALAQGVQLPTPRLSVSTPEGDVGCPIPTLAECQAEGYLTDDPCGILQKNNQWTCWQLIDAAVGEDTSGAGVGIIAYELDDLGVNNQVISYAEEPLSSQEAYYVTDAFSFSSQTARPNYGLASDFGIDIHAAWRASDDNIISCREYVYEKYFDQTEFERLVGVDQHNYRRVFEIAFDAGFKESSIGSQHLPNRPLCGFDGACYRHMFSGFPQPKNEFFRVLLDNGLPGNSRVPGAPKILESMRDYNAEGQLFYNAVIFDYEDNAETWQWHKEMSETLSVEGKKELGLKLTPPDTDPSDPFSTLELFNPQSVGEDNGVNGEIARWTGTVPEDQSGGKFLRRYLDAELNEFYDMQRRLLRLFREWYRADRRFAGSGWTVDRIAEEVPGDISSFVGQSREVPPFPGATVEIPPQFQFGPDDDTDDDGGLPTGVFPVAGFNVEVSEDIVRRRILEDILRLYRRAEAAGCLERGLTPCDWSPKRFARTVLHRFNELREDDYDRCNSYVPGGDLNQVLNLDVRFIDEPEDRCPEVAAEFNCRVQTGDTITRAGFEQLMLDVDFCLSRVPAYLEEKAKCEEQLALEAARARAFEVTELIDPSTGEIRAPGIGDGGSEDKGNRWFGLDYEWNYRFGSVLGDQACNIELFAGGLFDLTGKALTRTVPIIDAMAEVSTEDRRADLFFRVFTVPLFPSFQESFDIDATIRVNVVHSVEEERNFGSANTRFFIGPIPVRIEAGLAGGGGVNLSFDARADGFGQSGDEPNNCPSGRIIAGVEPFMQISGFVDASLNIVVAAVGVRGNLTLIRVEVPFDAELNVAVVPENPFDLAFPKNLNLSVETSLGLDINTLSGFFEVYGSIGPCPFCKRASKTLLRWDGLTFDRELFDQEYTIFLGDLLDAGAN